MRNGTRRRREGIRNYTISKTARSRAGGKYGRVRWGRTQTWRLTSAPSSYPQEDTAFNIQIRTHVYLDLDIMFCGWWQFCCLSKSNDRNTGLQCWYSTDCILFQLYWYIDISMGFLRPSFFISLHEIIILLRVSLKQFCHGRHSLWLYCITFSRACSNTMWNLADTMMHSYKKVPAAGNSSGKNGTAKRTLFLCGYHTGEAVLKGPIQSDTNTRVLNRSILFLRP